MRCQGSGCGKAATLHVTQVNQRRCVAEFHFCEEHAHQHVYAPAGAAGGEFAWAPGGTSEQLRGAVCFDLLRVIISEIHEQQLVVLREVGGERSYSLMLGIFEATTIDRRIKGLPSPRPLTHDVWYDSIGRLGGVLKHVLVDELRDHTYFAKLVIEQAGRELRVDVRPSDAYTLALIGNVPIHVAEGVVDEVCGR